MKRISGRKNAVGNALLEFTLKTQQQVVMNIHSNYQFYDDRGLFICRANQRIGFCGRELHMKELKPSELKVGIVFFLSISLLYALVHPRSIVFQQQVWQMEASVIKPQFFCPGHKKGLRMIDN